MAIIKKELSAGILFFTEDRELLMGRVTNSSLASGMPSRWDIPKGHVEENETPLRAAIRECWEETGFVDYDAALLVDLGQQKYASNKDLHVFVYPRPVRHEQFKNCVCTAYHEDPETGERFPEMDAFALIQPSQWLYVMGPSLYNVMQKLFPEDARPR